MKKSFTSTTTRCNYFCAFFAALGATCLSFLLYACDQYDGPKPPEGYIVSVDLGAGLNDITHAGSGFLYGFSATLPAADFFETLKPQLVRYHAMMEYPDPFGWHWEWNLPAEERGHTSIKSGEMIARLDSLGVRQHIIAGMEFTNRGYHELYGWPGDPETNGKLPNDLLEEVLVEQVEYVLSQGIRNIEWDIWNEPDWRDFWPEDRFPGQFLETWKFAYDVIRSVDPDAIIVGPSYAFFDPFHQDLGATMKEFLLFAQEHDCLPDRLVWHELHGDDSHRDIGMHVQMMRDFMAGDLGIEPLPIDIPEIIVPAHIWHPGVHVWHFAELEKAGVEGACHAVWDEGDPIWHPDFPENAINLSSGIWAGHLCHLMTRADQDNPFKPRASWYTYFYYAQLEGQRLQLEHDAFSPVNGIGALGAEDDALRLLLGSDAGRHSEIILVIENATKVFPGKKEIKFRITHIPEYGDQHLASPESSVIVQPVQDGKVNLQLTFRPYEAIFLEVE